MKYVVICYALHNEEVSSFKSFDNYEKAILFLEKDAKNTYHEKRNNLGDSSIEFELNLDSDYAMLSYLKGEYKWTWEILKIN